MKLIARFIKRGRDGEDDNGAIMILAKGGIEYLEEDMIYEITEDYGELHIRPVGKTHMTKKMWNQPIGDVARFCSPIMTKEEAADV